MSLFAELKRRNVFRVGAVYVIVAWLLIQVADTVFPALGLPDWTVTFVIAVLGLGFPVALLFAWAFEITPEGLKLEKDIDRGESITRHTGRKLDRAAIAVLALALAYFVADKFLFQSDLPSAPVTSQDQATAAPAAESAGPDVQPVPMPVAAEAPREPHQRSIAVLPFVNMSDDPGNEFFSDGISEELLNLLAKIPELRVTSRSSAFAFKGQPVEIPDVARRLNVAHVLEGSVRKAGQRVRITAQLIDARSDTHLWSETYDRTLDDIFAIQDEIAAVVVEQLRVTLLGAVPRVEETTPEAYELYLRAEQLRAMLSEESLKTAEGFYQRALALDPGYAPARIGLATIYVNQAHNGLLPLDEGYARARREVETVLAARPDYPRAHDLMAWFVREQDNDLQAAAHHLSRALVLDPANLATLNNAAPLLEVLGRRDEAIAVMEYVVGRDPLDATTTKNLAAYYRAADRFAEAERVGRKALELSPDALGVRNLIGYSLLRQGRVEEGLLEIEREPSDWGRIPDLFAAYHELGRAEEAAEVLEQLILLDPQYEQLYRAASAALKNQPDAAFDWLQQAVAAGLPLGGLHQAPVLVNLHADPRWLPLLEELGQSPEQLAAIEFEVRLPE